MKTYVTSKLKLYYYKYKNKLLSLITFLNNLVVLLSALVTIYGVFFLKSQVVLINTQLHELNAQPDLKIYFHTNSAVLFGQTVSEPLEINLTTGNKGEKIATYWRASLSFCKDINVTNEDHGWIKQQKNIYEFESNKVIPPSFPEKLNYYSDNLDHVGYFQIRVSNKNNSNSDKPIPIGDVTITGDYPNPSNYLVWLTPNTGFSYQNLIAPNGWMIKDYLEILSNCFDVVSKN